MGKGKRQLLKNIERAINIFAFLGLITLSANVLIYQLIIHQPPCSLCLLQRAGFLFMALGFLLNIRFGLRASHYAIILLSSCLSALIALRQLAITHKHLTLLFAVHQETWAFAISLLMVVVVTILPAIERRKSELHGQQSYWKAITNSLCGILGSVILVNMLSAIWQWV